MAEKEWIIRQPDVTGLFEGCGFTGVLSMLLANRGVRDAQSAAEYLACDGPLHDPMLMKDMPAAVERIRRAVDEKEKIVIYGDYDVDGVTATALLYKALYGMGADVSCYIPDRESEGYGMNAGAVKRIAEGGAALVVTVDTGISAFDEARMLKSLSVDLIITDHHEPRDTLPDALAVVNPRQPGCAYPFKGLAGVGVAFKLACALAGGTDENLLSLYGPLVCLGTVADVVPLTGENRLLVSRGLERIPESDDCGIRAMLDVSGASGKKLTAGLLSFTLAPRINACGRMGSAADALSLFTTAGPDEARSYAMKLDGHNRRRQEIENEILLGAVAAIEADETILRNPVILVAGEGWHNGVIGIVASRLVERYRKPSIVVSLEGEEGRASCRSVEGFHLHEALKSCAGLLERFGGHELAAGFTVRRENLEPLYGALNRYALSLPHPPRLTLVLDCELQEKDLTINTAKQLAVLEPCGSGNPAPLFYIEAARVRAVTPVGGGSHLRLSCVKGAGRFDAMVFYADKRGFDFRPGDFIDLAVTLDVNVYRERESLSLIVRDFRQAVAHRRQKQLYERFLCGETIAAAPGSLAPVREEFAAVYRLLSAPGRTDGDLDGICSLIGAKIKTFGYFKLRLILDVFSELGLITYSIQNGRLQFEVDNAKKIDLGRSQLLKKAGGVNDG